MASEIFVHVGTQKSGTTYLQEVLTYCAEPLARAGLLYPLPPGGPRPGMIENHEYATYGLLGTEYPWVSEERAARFRADWERLVGQIAEWDGPVLLSGEALAVIRTPAIQTLLKTLPADDVHVLITARGLGKTLPSLWQQHIRNGNGSTFDEYLTALAEQRERLETDVEDSPTEHYWRAFALGRLARRWMAEVGDDRVTLITNPGSPPELLWSRFTAAASLPRIEPPTDLVGTPVHTGLTADEAVLLGALNLSMREAGFSASEAARLRDAVVKEGFLGRSERGPRVVIPESWRERVARWNAQDIAEVRDSGVRILGDLSDLDQMPSPADAGEPTARDVGLAGAVAVLAAAAAASRPLEGSKPGLRRFLRKPPRD